MNLKKLRRRRFHFEDEINDDLKAYISYNPINGLLKASIITSLMMEYLRFNRLEKSIDLGGNYFEYSYVLRSLTFNILAVS